MSTVLETLARPGSDEFAANDAAHRALVEDLRARLAHAARGGGPEAQEKLRARGKLTVRERVDRLCDPHTAFLELSALAATGLYDDAAPAAGVVTYRGQPVDGAVVTFISPGAVSCASPRFVASGSAPGREPVFSNARSASVFSGKAMARFARAR